MKLECWISEKPVPSSQNDLQCSIYQFYPLDCRTYPLLPSMNYRRELEWELSGTLSIRWRYLIRKFAGTVRKFWQELVPVLPQAWWDLYDFADHWKGWPEPMENRQCPLMSMDRMAPSCTKSTRMTRILLDIACDLFASIFPEDIVTFPICVPCAMGRHPSHPNTLDHVWLVEQGGEWVGLRIFSYIITRDFGYGAYVGFLPKVRGQGLGSWLVGLVHEQLDMDARAFGKPGSIGYLGEVERPIDCTTDEERREAERRLQFHRRCGAIILPVPFIESVMIEGVDYLSPEDVRDESPRPMYLVFNPSKRGSGNPKPGPC